MLLTNKERYRLNKLKVFEKECYSNGYELVAGIDEVGRGPLAGPVVACAVILPKKINIKKINDSKKLTKKDREDICSKLISNPKVIYAVSIIEHTIIDKINIFQSSLLAMKNAVNKLKVKPDYLLFDGKFHPQISTPSKAIIKGDSKSISISAASIIAKVTRDKIMIDYHEKYPEYRFDLHKGYGTKLHKKALLDFGPCEIHRKSFAPVRILT